MTATNPPANEILVHQRPPHAKQRAFIDSPAKRKIIRAGRRSGKTTGIAIYAVDKFLAGRRVLYATPTAEQITRFWFEVCEALADPVSQKVFYKNETEHVIMLPHTEQRLRAKTAWNADTLRGDYADVLILDEFQLMNEDAWVVVGVPMLLDNNGDAVFIYTPPSLRSASVSKAHDPRYAAKLYQRATQDTTGRWAAFHFTSHDNPYISKDALNDIVGEMTQTAYRQEILAEDVEDAPGALWKRAWLDSGRVLKLPDDIIRKVVAMDPATTSGSRSDDCGIIAASASKIGNKKHLYITDDATMHGTPDQQARAAITLYYQSDADVLVVEDNNGGEWLETVIKNIDSGVRIKRISASRGKAVRAEPISAVYEQGRGHHVGMFPRLEDELCQWEPGHASPNRLDALVWAATELLRGGSGSAGAAPVQPDNSAYRIQREGRWQRARR